MQVSQENTMYIDLQALVTDQSQKVRQVSNLSLLLGSEGKEGQRLCEEIEPQTGHHSHSSAERKERITKVLQECGSTEEDLT